jgi:[ribosomal protein S5]-alanine N-acetyltransferase
MNRLSIKTARLELIAGTAELTKAIASKTGVSQLLNAELASSWPAELLREAEPWIAETLAKNPASAGWWIWYIVLSDDSHHRTVIGNTGFKGEPSSEGVCEIGYALVPEFYGRGIATEAAATLIEWVFKSPNVTMVIGETLPELTGSIRVMEKCAMKYIGAGSEPGTVRYGRNR